MPLTHFFFGSLHGDVIMREKNFHHFLLLYIERQYIGQAKKRREEKEEEKSLFLVFHDRESMFNLSELFER